MSQRHPLDIVGLARRRRARLHPRLPGAEDAKPATKRRYPPPSSKILTQPQRVYSAA